jgi:hypothetical protein
MDLIGFCTEHVLPSFSLSLGKSSQSSRL